MLVELTTPITVTILGTSVTLTHARFSFESDPDQITSKREVGVIVGGTFQEYAPLREIVTIEGETHAGILAADAKGKKQGRFRNDDVQVAHDKLKGRL